jgi:LEA14-like dessication related protein
MDRNPLRAAVAALAFTATLARGEAPAPAAAVAPAAARGPLALALKDCSVDSVEASGTTLAFTAELSNPTSERVMLGGVSYALDVEGKRVFEGAVPGGVEVPAGGSTSVPLPGRIRYADIPGFAAKVALGKRVPYRLVVAAAVRTAAGDVTVPVAREGDLSVPRTPGFELEGLRIKSMNPAHAAIEVSVKVQNENSFPLPKGLLRYRISVAGGEIASAEGALPVIGPGEKASIAIPVKLSLRSAGRGVVKALKGDAALVGLHGVASVGELSFPVDLEAHLPTRR